MPEHNYDASLHLSHPFVAEGDDVGKGFVRHPDVFWIQVALLKVSKPNYVREMPPTYHSSMLCPSKAYAAASATLTPRFMRQLRQASLR